MLLKGAGVCRCKGGGPTEDTRSRRGGEKIDSAIAPSWRHVGFDVCEATSRLGATFPFSSARYHPLKA